MSAGNWTWANGEFVWMWCQIVGQMRNFEWAIWWWFSVVCCFQHCAIVVGHNALCLAVVMRWCWLSHLMSRPWCAPFVPFVGFVAVRTVKCGIETLICRWRMRFRDGQLVLVKAKCPLRQKRRPFCAFLTCVRSSGMQDFWASDRNSGVLCAKERVTIVKSSRTELLSLMSCNKLVWIMSMITKNDLCLQQKRFEMHPCTFKSTESWNGDNLSKLKKTQSSAESLQWASRMQNRNLENNLLLKAPQRGWKAFQWTWRPFCWMQFKSEKKSSKERPWCGRSQCIAADNGFLNWRQQCQLCWMSELTKNWPQQRFEKNQNAIEKQKKWKLVKHVNHMQHIIINTRSWSKAGKQVHNNVCPEGLPWVSADHNTETQASKEQLKQKRQQTKQNLNLNLSFRANTTTNPQGCSTRQGQVQPSMAQTICVEPHIHQSQTNLQRKSIWKACNLHDGSRILTVGSQLQAQKMNWHLIHVCNNKLQKLHKHVSSDVQPKKTSKVHTDTAQQN